MFKKSFDLFNKVPMDEMKKSCYTKSVNKNEGCSDSWISVH